ncbi:MAG: C_GCAxxG_C_C family protein [Opitutaceae bacterium]|nr:C_GCAxxG_C_C family protein [Opitutaceae bacterium]
MLHTLLTEHGRPDLEMVRGAGGLAGGIGGPGECGGACAPLMMLGLLHGGDLTANGLPRVVLLGREYLRRFGQVHGSTRCTEIGTKGIPSCLQAMCTAPALLREVRSREDELHTTLPPEVSQAHLSVLSAFEQQGFHCAHRVLEELGGVLSVTEDLRRASWPFQGGMVLSGGTCGALTAGVMAASAKIGGVERSTLRTLRLVAFLLLDEERAMDDRVNAFNPVIRIARGLSSWFIDRYGTTRCAELTGTNFATSESAERFRAAEVDRCEAIARSVADRVREVLEEEERLGSRAGSSPQKRP